MEGNRVDIVVIFTRYGAPFSSIALYNTLEPPNVRIWAQESVQKHRNGGVRRGKVGISLA